MKRLSGVRVLFATLCFLCLAACDEDDNAALTYPQVYKLSGYDFMPSKYFHKTSGGYNQLLTSAFAQTETWLQAELDSIIAKNEFPIVEVTLEDETTLRVLAVDGSEFMASYEIEGDVMIMTLNGQEDRSFKVDNASSALDYCITISSHTTLSPNSPATIRYNTCTNATDTEILDEISLTDNLIEGDSIVLNSSDLVFNLQ